MARGPNMENGLRARPPAIPRIALPDEELDNGFAPEHSLVIGIPPKANRIPNTAFWLGR